jgi:uncharacterized membrane protein
MSGQRSAVLIACAVIAPTVAFSLSIAIARRFAIGSASLDYAALAVSVAFGMPFAWLLPRRLSVRLLLCVVSAAVLAAWLVVYGFGFVCSMYRDCP